MLSPLRLVQDIGSLFVKTKWTEYIRKENLNCIIISMQNPFNICKIPSIYAKSLQYMQNHFNICKIPSIYAKSLQYSKINSILEKSLQCLQNHFDICN